jgi:hypothetical protein
MKKPQPDTLKQRIQLGNVNCKSSRTKKEKPVFPDGKNSPFFIVLFLKKEDNATCLLKYK